MTWKKPALFCLLTKLTKISRGPTTDISKFVPGFMFLMDFTFFNVEIIRGFTSESVAICSANSHSFVFLSRSKRPPLDIIKKSVTKLTNQHKKVSFIQFDEYGALAIFSGSMKTCHNMNVILQNKGGDVSSINGKSESPNKTLTNITRDLLLNSSHKEELWCFVYQYGICLSCLTYNILCGDVT